MTDPVNTDALRELATHCNANNYDANNGWLLGSSGDALNAAADEVDRLRAKIENAPHSAICGWYEAKPCTCWKSRA